MYVSMCVCMYERVSMYIHTFKKKNFMIFCQNHLPFLMLNKNNNVVVDSYKENNIIII